MKAKKDDSNKTGVGKKSAKKDPLLAELLKQLGIAALPMGFAGGTGSEALDLVYAAQDTEDDEQAFMLIERALILDPNCIAAYEFLGNAEAYPAMAIPHYAYGVQLGRKQFGGKYLKENKGMFYGLIETRPFMRCLYQYGRCAYYLNRLPETLATYWELLELNPNDNQGVRYELGSLLLKAGDLKGFQKLETAYAEESSALWQYNRLLGELLRGRDEVALQSLLADALAANPHIPKLLLAKNLPASLPTSYSWGSGEEGAYYASFARPAWQVNAKALEWLRGHTPPPSRKKKKS